MTQAAPDKPQHRAHNSEPEQNRDFSDGRNAAIKKDDEKDNQSAGKGASLPAAERIEILGVIGETDRGGGDGERGLNQGLPNKEEGHEASPTRGAVSLTQKNVCTSRLRHGRAEFRPDKSIQSGEQRAG